MLYRVHITTFHLTRKKMTLNRGEQRKDSGTVLDTVYCFDSARMMSSTEVLPCVKSENQEAKLVLWKLPLIYTFGLC